MSTVDTPAATSGDASGFNILSPELFDDFWPQINALRERCPVGWSEQAWDEAGTKHGFWVINDYADVMAAATNWKAFSSADGAAPVQFDLDVLRMIPLETDPPLHRGIRKQLNPFFTPEALASQEDRLAEIVDRLMSRALAKGEAEGAVDFIQEFTRQLPPLVFFEGFLEQREEDIGWILDILAVLLTAPEKALEVAPPLFFWEAAQLHSRFEEGRRDDLTGVIAHLGREDGDDGLELDDMQRIMTMNLMIMAGMETTMGGLASVAVSLARVPEIRTQIRAGDETLLDRAVDEFLRFETPVPSAGRTLTQDMELRGCPMKHGDRILVNWAAANRDPQHFPDPDTLDFERSNAASHVAFGAGIHRCLGNHLARRETKAMMRAICALSTFEVEPGFVPTFKPSFARGPMSLPVRLAR
jgi:cytochrome P450